MTAVEPLEGADLLDALCAATTMLGRVLLEPVDAETLARLRGVDLREEWPLPGGSAGAHLVAEDLDADVDVDSLAADHRALFSAPDHSLANPYESVRLGEEHLVLGSHTLAVRAAYEEWGLAAPDAFSVPDDHLGLELAFVAHLLGAALDAADSGDTEAQDAALGAASEFCEEHLLAFGPEVARDIVGRATTDFYRGWGLMLDDLLGLLRLHLL